MNRVDRLFAILLHLQGRRVTTAASLAARFEVSLRTLYRDLAALGEAGVPLVAEAAADGAGRLALRSARTVRGQENALGDRPCCIYKSCTSCPSAFSSTSTTLPISVLTAFFLLRS